MKLVFTFLMFLCCCLPGRNIYAHTGSHNVNHCRVQPADAAKEIADVVPTIPNHFVAGQAGVNPEDHDLVCIEDEADENVLKKPVNRYVSALYSLFFSVSYSCPSHHLFFCRYLPHTDSCKYIAQRVLRI